MNIWIVTGSSGSYDDRYQYNVKGFTSEEAANEFVNSQPKVNYLALQELEELKWEYIDMIDVTDYDKWTQDEWDINDKLRCDAEDKAKVEIQSKYPDADLTLDLEFNGYSIEQLEVFE